MNWLSNLPLFLYLGSIPLVSMGTTGGQSGLTWLGLLCVLCASLITPGLRLRSNVQKTGPSTGAEQPEENDR